MHVEGSNNFCLSGEGDPKTHGNIGGFCGTWCADCPVGSHSSEAGSLECSICPKNTFAEQAKTRDCSLCKIGQSTEGKSGSTKCVACPSGFYNDKPGNDCKPCASGSFSIHTPGQEAGASECIKCKGDVSARQDFGPSILLAVSSTCGHVPFHALLWAQRHEVCEPAAGGQKSLRGSPRVALACCMIGWGVK